MELQVLPAGLTTVKWSDLFNPKDNLDKHKDAGLLLLVPAASHHSSCCCPSKGLLLRCWQAADSLAQPQGNATIQSWWMMLDVELLLVASRLFSAAQMAVLRFDMMRIIIQITASNSK
jgi:hypothetical protein